MILGPRKAEQNLRVIVPELTAFPARGLPTPDSLALKQWIWRSKTSFFYDSRLSIDGGRQLAARVIFPGAYVSGSQLPWKPKGMRWGVSTLATGPEPGRCASNT